MPQDDNKNSEDLSLENTSTIIQPNKNGGNDAPSGQGAGSGDPSPDKKPQKKHSFLKRFSVFANLYFVIFIILLLLAAGVIFITIRSNNKNNNTQTQTAQSLTDKQITDLKGNTTLVGDSQRTLDIQGNSIFEGSVLMRNNLDVAGSIKVGGSLSLPAITVGGTSTFGQIQVSQSLTVSGNTILQGQLTIQKGLTVTGAANFGSLSVGALNVSTLQINGDFVVSRHVNISGSTPSRGGGSALGAGGTVSNNGTDTAGTVTINTGGSPPAGCFVTLNFTQRFGGTPRVIISPSNSNAGTIDYYTNRSNTNFSICTASPPAAGASYVFDYFVID